MYGCCARSRCSPSRPIISTLRPFAPRHRAVAAAHLRLFHDLPYKRQIRVIKRPLAGHTHCSRWPCNFRLEDLPASLAPYPAPFFRQRSLLRWALFFFLHTRTVGAIQYSMFLSQAHARSQNCVQFTELHSAYVSLQQYRRDTRFCAFKWE